jgi:putative acetyltransferase
LALHVTLRVIYQEPDDMQVRVRKAIQSDMQSISDVVTAAFGGLQGKEISALIDDLLADPSAQPLLSLVATTKKNIVGHILFSKAIIKRSSRKASAAMLAPLAVRPEFHGQGIGGHLINEGLRRMTAARVDLVFVLGHPTYYPKYGFSTAGIKGFEAPYPIPPGNSAAWMVQELRPGIFERVRGQVLCADALNNPKHWRE